MESLADCGESVSEFDMRMCDFKGIFAVRFSPFHGNGAKRFCFKGLA